MCRYNVHTEHIWACVLLQACLDKTFSSKPEATLSYQGTDIHCSSHSVYIATKGITNTDTHETSKKNLHILILATHGYCNLMVKVIHEYRNMKP